MTDSYANAPQEFKDTAKTLVASFGADSALLEGAIVAALDRAVFQERQACATLVEGMGIPRVIAKARVLMLPTDLASAIRNRS